MRSRGDSDSLGAADRSCGQPEMVPRSRGGEGFAGRQAKQVERQTVEQKFEPVARLAAIFTTARIMADKADRSVPQRSSDAIGMGT